MEHKNDTFFNQVVAACKAKNLRDVMHVCDLDQEAGGCPGKGLCCSA
jgi:hypothetical protein